MKQSKIYLPEEVHAQQLNLFKPTNLEPVGNLDPFPEFLSTLRGLEKIVDRATVKDGLGIDFEFKYYNKPSIVGLANVDLMGAISADKKFVENSVKWCITNKIPLVGHSFIGAERRVIKEWLGIEVPLELIEDSMLRHYLLNQAMCKNTTKEDDEGSLGFMNLYTAASMVLDIYQWKICRKSACEGPCPSHDVWGYCAADSWTSVAANKIQKQQMKEEGVPEQLYRELLELSVICDEMEQQGLRIDIPYVEKINKEMEEEKDKIFEYEVYGKNKIFKEFNPRSSDQIQEWFSKTNIPLKSADIKYISKILEKEGNKAGYGELQDYVEFLEENVEQITSPQRELYKLYTFKSSGKGTDSWFSEKYRTKDFIHPRFVVSGTSSGRLSSSKPNGANIPQRGWAVVEDDSGNEFNRIKACIIPRDESLDFLEADYAQQEFRGVLWFSGIDPKEAGEDAYTWLVNRDYNAFRKAAASWPGLDPDKPKDVRYCAKTLGLAANYLETIEIFYSEDMMRPAFKRQVANGAVRLYKDWEYNGGIVGFTGSNLAQRFFGSKSDANRKHALDIMEDIYFKAFPQIRNWQKKVLAEVEAKGKITSPTGRFLRLNGTPRDNGKIACAFLGQGCTGADHAQAVMLKFKRELGVIPALVVHDSMLLEIDRNWTDKQARDFIQPMAEETWRLPNFSCPIDVKRGRNYGSLKKLKV